MSLTCGPRVCGPSSGRALVDRHVEAAVRRPLSLELKISNTVPTEQLVFESSPGTQFWYRAQSQVARWRADVLRSAGAAGEHGSPRSSRCGREPDS